MKQEELVPRIDWPRKVEELGFHFHTIDGVYWDERACYRFTSAEVDKLELATGELQSRCIDAAGRVIESGDYERFFVRDSKRYCHILDPRTGWPVDGPQAVSVIAPLCTVAGSCATIAMLKGDGAEEYLREQGLPYLLVDREGTVSGTLTSTIP